MIVASAPLRLGLLGGGSDYPEFFGAGEVGSVLGTTINLRVYVAGLPLFEGSPEKFRFTYRITESVQDVTEIQHPVARATLEHLNWQQPLNLATMADVPGGSGLGSSSAFTVALLALLRRLRGERIHRLEIAREAVYVERTLVGEAGGWQDQFQCAFGGLRMYEFTGDQAAVSDDLLRTGNLNFSDQLTLVSAGFHRDSAQPAAKTSRRLMTDEGREAARAMSALACEAYAQLTSGTGAHASAVLGPLMRHAWEWKRSMVTADGDSFVDEIIERGYESGALAGKLCGAGEAGFVLLVHPAERAVSLRRSLEDLHPIEVVPSSEAVIVN